MDFLKINSLWIFILFIDLIDMVLEVEVLVLKEVIVIVLGDLVIM